MSNHRYLPMTEEDRKEMLQVVGANDVADLFADIPTKVRPATSMNIKPALKERDLLKHFTELSNRNVSTKDFPSFLGAGVYDHHIPATVDAVISRSEFYTAYTPYQPEISQGELQAIFEFQTMIAEITGMDLANSSMYDGHTALAEAVVMVAGHLKMKKQRVLVSDTVHPEARDVIDTYVLGPRLNVASVNEAKGKTDVNDLKEKLDDDVCAVVVQYPNFYGGIEDLKAIREACDESGAMMIVKSNPLALGVLTPPGEFGADVVVGDTQPFGIPSQYGTS